MDEYQMIGDFIDMMYEDRVSGYEVEEFEEEIWLTQEEEEENEALRHEGWIIP